MPFVGRWTLSAACVTVGTSREARRLPLACMAKSAETRPRNAWAVAWTREPKGDSSRMRSYGLQRPLRCGPAPRSLSLWGAFFLPQHTIYVGQLLVIFVATRSGGGAIAAEWYGIQHCPRGNAEFQPAYRLCRLYRHNFVGWAKLSGDAMRGVLENAPLYIHLRIRRCEARQTPSIDNGGLSIR